MIKPVLIAVGFVGTYLAYDQLRNKISSTFKVDAIQMEKDIFNESELTKRVEASNFLNKDNDKIKTILKMGYFADALLAGEYDKN